jgi:hypothetical protein
MSLIPSFGTAGAADTVFEDYAWCFMKSGTYAGTSTDWIWEISGSTSTIYNAAGAIYTGATTSLSQDSDSRRYYDTGVYRITYIADGSSYNTGAVICCKTPTGLEPPAGISSPGFFKLVCCDDDSGLSAGSMDGIWCDSLGVVSETNSVSLTESEVRVFDYINHNATDAIWCPCTAPILISGDGTGGGFYWYMDSYDLNLSSFGGTLIYNNTAVTTVINVSVTYDTAELFLTISTSSSELI